MQAEEQRLVKTSTPVAIMKKNLVGNLIRKADEQLSGYSKRLSPDESILSFNKVTGHSVNFPIAGTCQPTKVCSRRCYYAKGASSWPNSLKKQQRLFNTVQADPIGTGDRLVREIMRKWKRLSFLRWNGGGDLFDESVEMLNHVAAKLPEVQFWVVTRILGQAAKVAEAPNVFVHFSLDGASLNRREKYETMQKLSQNYFYSYQCDVDEMPSGENLAGVSVVFFDRYIPTGDMKRMEKETICPLNTRDDITNTCETCRRCFDDAT
jgi:hypothetical protein